MNAYEIPAPGESLMDIGHGMNNSCLGEDPDLILDDAASGPVFGCTVLSKTGGPLTKVITLTPDGKIHSDGSACIMSTGMAHRRQMTLEAFGQLIARLEHNQAIALGQLRHDLPDAVRIVTKAQLRPDHPPDVVAQSAGVHLLRNQRSCADLDRHRQQDDATSGQATGG